MSIATIMNMMGALPDDALVLPAAHIFARHVGGGTLLVAVVKDEWLLGNKKREDCDRIALADVLIQPYRGQIYDPGDQFGGRRIDQIVCSALWVRNDETGDSMPVLERF